MQVSLTGVIWCDEDRINMRIMLAGSSGTIYINGIKNHIEKWGPNDLETMKQIGIWYRLVGVFVEEGKWKKLIRHPLFMIAMYCLRLKVALGYFQSTK